MPPSVSRLRKPDGTVAPSALASAGRISNPVPAPPAPRIAFAATASARRMDPGAVSRSSAPGAAK